MKHEIPFNNILILHVYIQNTRNFIFHSQSAGNVDFHCNWSSESHSLLQLSSSLNATLSSSVIQDHFKEIFNKTA
jgi:hypothetical protein